MTVTLYGIRNCDTMKKACAWLEGNGIAYTFHDYRKAGVSRTDLERWCAVWGWEKVLNRAGTTFRKLPDAVKESLSAESALALMLEQPSMIRRPVLETPEPAALGFKPDDYARIFAGPGASA